MLFEAVAGVRPFEAPNEIETILKHIHEAPPRASELNPDLPEQLVELIDSCLAKDVAKRPRSADELARALRRCQATLEKISKPLSVTLGCRQGQLESTFDEMQSAVKKQKQPVRKRRMTRGTPKKTKLSMSSVGTGQQAPFIASAIGDHVPAGRRWLFGLALLFVLLGVGLHYGLQSPPGQVASLNVVEIGSHGVLVEFEANWETSRPELSVMLRGGSVAVDCTTIASRRQAVADRKELPYRYAIAVTGLQREKAYSVAVIKPDGERSLPVSFTTRGARTSKVEVGLALLSSGDLAITMSSPAPFIVKDVVGALPEENSEGRLLECGTKMSLVVSQAAVLANKEVTAVIHSLDGPRQERRYAVRQFLVERAEQVFRNFMKDYRSGDMYRTFYGRSGRPAEYFRDYGQELVNIRKRGETPAGQWFESLWTRLDERLSSRYPWYVSAVALAPGCSLLCRAAQDIALTAKLDLAMAPLRSIQGAAFFQKLPPHPQWGEAILLEKQVGTRVATPFISQPTVERQFNETTLIVHPQYTMLAAKHPQASGSVISAEAERAMDTHERVLDLSGLQPSDYEEAELELFVNDANVHRLYLVEVNEGSFTAAVQTARKDFEAQAKTAGGEDSYMKLGMLIFSGLGSEAMSAETMITELAKSNRSGR